MLKPHTAWGLAFLQSDSQIHNSIPRIFDCHYVITSPMTESNIFFIRLKGKSKIFQVFIYYFRIFHFIVKQYPAKLHSGTNWRVPQVTIQCTHFSYLILW